MSLDVYLLGEPKEVKCTCLTCGNEHTHEDNEELYWANITHNLNKMADAAGLYEALWRPDEIGITKASELIGKLGLGLYVLKSDKDTFEKLAPANGWGSYNGLVSFVEKYLEACQDYPNAIINVSR